jgi:hypothetical protein
MKRDIQTGLTDRMVQQRHVGGFHVFLVCGVWFYLKDLRFFPNSPIDWLQLSRFHLKTETESSLRNVLCFK